jgi:hypothetical protein
MDTPADELTLDQAREQAERSRRAMEIADANQRRRAAAAPALHAEHAKRTAAHERQGASLARVFRRHTWRRAIHRRQPSAGRRPARRPSCRRRRAPRASGRRSATRAGPAAGSGDLPGEGDDGEPSSRRSAIGRSRGGA